MLSGTVGSAGGPGKSPSKGGKKVSLPQNQQGNKLNGPTMIELEELVGGTAEKRNWRGIIISLLVILLICALIVVAIIIASPDLRIYSKYTFEDIFDPQYQPTYYDAVWLTEDEYVLRNSTNNIVAVDVAANETTLLISNRTMDEEGIIRIWVHPDKQYILLSSDEQQLFRNSFEAVYKIYDVKKKSVIKTLTPPSVTDGPVPLRYASWVPNSAGLIFIYKNNLYYQNAVNNDPVAVTTDGTEGEVFNGVPDWVYEEEILSDDDALYWNKDGSRLVFAQFNDTQVPKAWYPCYENKVYSEIKYVNYPKPGYPNPTIKLLVMPVEDATNLVQLQPPRQFQDQEYYYRSVVWKDRYQVAVTWWNRPQNVSVTTICQVDTGVCDLNYEQETPNGWIVQRGDIIFAEDGLSYFTILPEREGPRGSFYHIAQVTAESGQRGQVTFLTQGIWEVTQIVGYNAERNLLFYLSTENGSINRTLYSLNIVTKERTCLTCDVIEGCSYVSADFNDKATRYILQCYGPDVPQTFLNSIDSANFTVLVDNAGVKAALADKDFVVKTFHTVKSSDGNFDIQIELLIPRSMDDQRRHPLLVDVYAGPGTQQVDAKYHQGWYSYLSSNHHVIIARIDGRGSAYNGQKLLYEIYKRLGTVEIEDQITATDYLLDTYRYLDWNKTAIWGWSYGGFAATLAATYGKFNCTMAVAPVTDWRFYDSVYTEKYMGLPKATDNLQAYKDSNISARASGLHNTKYLLVHGLADDNVHFQNSANLVKALVQEGVQHQVQYYTDENHALGDPMVQKDLYRVLTDFLVRSFDLKC
nr:inactive dipeptidyl peptidase 10-like isoform X2 [Lytechinus pictus]